MTLRQAVDRAIQQNPDVTLARLEEENARHAVGVAKDPFSPKVNVGSGLAYSNGFPLSAPSIVQAHASQFIFNRQQSYMVAQAREQARGAGLDVARRRDEVAYRTATLYLDAEPRHARSWRARPRASRRSWRRFRHKQKRAGRSRSPRNRPRTTWRVRGRSPKRSMPTATMRRRRSPSPWASPPTTAFVRSRSSVPRPRCRDQPPDH